MVITTDQIISLFERSNVDGLRELGGVEGLATEFNTDLKTGLLESEKVDNYQERRQKYGVNVLPDPPKQSWCSMFIDCFRDLMLKILLVSAILSLILTSVFPPDGKLKFADYIDTISIFVAVLIVSIVQTQTNYSQQQAFLEINKLKNEFNVTVIRGGIEQQVLNIDLLVGDLVVLKNGDRVPADGIYINGHNLKVNNSQETGESVAVNVNESKPFCLGGGAVESGDAHVLIVAVGENSQSGVIMMNIQKMSAQREQSPLEKKLDRVAVIITYIGGIGSLLTFIVLLIFWIVEIVKDGWYNGRLNDLVNRFMIGVTIFICAVPEGLPLAVTLSLGFSMKKMMNDNNFVRHLQACETMGGATTICSDKTGTLTQNKMTVVKFFMDGIDTDGEPELTSQIKELLSESIAINSNAYMTFNEKSNMPEYIGSSSECALLQMLPKYNINYKEIRENNPIVILHEFDSTRKRMSTIINKNGQHRIYIKGAPDFVLKSCTQYVTKDGNILNLNEQKRQEFTEHISSYADLALRTMLLAYQDIGNKNEEVRDEWNDPQNVEKDLIVLCLVGIQDPLRPEVVHAIEQCKTANVMVRMVTGDFINTAKAIAYQCGILSVDGIAMMGEEFSSRSKLDLIEILPKLQVMARSSPRDKYRLVSLLMESGEVVAVTGDGSNDSAALKKANIGLSMGLCGTELAKMASDIVILDDNFNSIVSALKWGRCIYDNVRGFLQFQLTVNFAAMIIAFIGSIALKESPLKTLQLLWVNLIMDSLGALALATKGPTDALLLRPPYGESDGLISNILVRNIVGQCIYQMIFLLLILFGAKKIFHINEPVDDAQSIHVSTMVFNTFVYFQVFNLINSRVTSSDMNVFDGLFSNWVFIFIFVLIAALQAIITEFGGSAFETTHLNWKEWLICLALGFGSLIIGALLRLIKLKDRTSEKLNVLRAQRKQQMIKRYNGKSIEEQWAEDFNPDDQNIENEKKKKKKNKKSKDVGFQNESDPSEFEMSY